MGRRGKIEVVPTKPLLTQRDLSLAYSPGVAEPCLEIAKDPDRVYRLHRQAATSSRSSPTAPPCSGSATSAPLARQAGDGGQGACLFKQFADIDVFDIEIDAEDPDD